MSNPVWPTADLPLPDREGFQIRPQDPRRKRQSDAGPPGYRRRFSARAKFVQMKMLLTRNQRAIFDRFYDDDCEMGTRAFWMPDPTTERWPLASTSGQLLLASPGTLLVMSGRWLCHWGDEVPAETVVGTRFQKAFDLAVLP